MRGRRVAPDRAVACKTARKTALRNPGEILAATDVNAFRSGDYGRPRIVKICAWRCRDIIACSRRRQNRRTARVRGACRNSARKIGSTVCESPGQDGSSRWSFHNGYYVAACCTSPARSDLSDHRDKAKRFLRATRDRSSALPTPPRELAFCGATADLRFRNTARRGARRLRAPRRNYASPQRRALRQK